MVDHRATFDRHLLLDLRMQEAQSSYGSQQEVTGTDNTEDGDCGLFYWKDLLNLSRSSSSLDSSPFWSSETQIHYRMGLALQAQERYQESVEAFQAALSSFYTHHRRFSQSSNNNNKDQFWYDVLETKATSSSSLVHDGASKVWMSLGKSQQKLGRWRLAIQSLKTATRHGLLSGRSWESPWQCLVRTAQQAVATTKIAKSRDEDSLLVLSRPDYPDSPWDTEFHLRYLQESVLAEQRGDDWLFENRHSSAAISEYQLATYLDQEVNDDDGGFDSAWLVRKQLVASLLGNHPEFTTKTPQGSSMFLDCNDSSHHSNNKDSVLVQMVCPELLTGDFECFEKHSYKTAIRRYHQAMLIISLHQQMQTKEPTLVATAKSTSTTEMLDSVLELQELLPFESLDQWEEENYLQDNVDGFRKLKIMSYSQGDAQRLVQSELSVPTENQTSITTIGAINTTVGTEHEGIIPPPIESLNSQNKPLASLGMLLFAVWVLVVLFPIIWHCWQTVKFHFSFLSYSERTTTEPTNTKPTTNENEENEAESKATLKTITSPVEIKQSITSVENEDGYLLLTSTPGYPIPNETTKSKENPKLRHYWNIWKARTEVTRCLLCLEELEGKLLTFLEDSRKEEEEETNDELSVLEITTLQLFQTSREQLRTAMTNAESSFDETEIIRAYQSLQLESSKYLETLESAVSILHESSQFSNANTTVH